MAHVTASSVASAASTTIPSHRRDVGRDVHNETVGVAIARRAPGDVEVVVADRGTIPNNRSRLAKVLDALRPACDIARPVVYEAGPCGYGSWRRVDELGVSCAVIGPFLTPPHRGARVKTDRLDARQLARYAGSGDPPRIDVPDTT